jgi:hypothetical protein
VPGTRACPAQILDAQSELWGTEVRMHIAGSCVRFTSLVQLEPWFTCQQANSPLDLCPFFSLLLGELTIFGRDC